MMSCRKLSDRGYLAWFSDVYPFGYVSVVKIKMSLVLDQIY